MNQDLKVGVRPGEVQDNKVGANQTNNPVVILDGDQRLSLILV